MFFKRIHYFSRFSRVLQNTKFRKDSVAGWREASERSSKYFFSTFSGAYFLVVATTLKLSQCQEDTPDPNDPNYYSYNFISGEDGSNPPANLRNPKTNNRSMNNNNPIPLHQFSIADAVDKAFPALVNIQARVAGPFGSEGIAAGSGFVFDAKNRLVATNYHVVQHAGRDKLLVTLSDGSKYNALVHSFDHLTDIAIVQITDSVDGRSSGKSSFFSRFHGDSNASLPEVSFGNSSSLRVGEFVVALGSPLNMQNTVTCGIVSSVNRHASEIGVAQRRTDYIQTDAAIDQGNSGGPLINLNGEVVGINTMKVANSGGISFAIPIDTAKVVLAQLSQKKLVERPYIGLKMLPVRRVNGRNAKEGVLISEVAPGSPADRGGLEAGDLVLTVDDTEIKIPYDIIKILGYDVGRTHKITVLKQDGSTKTCHVTSLAARL